MKWLKHILEDDYIYMEKCNDRQGINRAEATIIIKNAFICDNIMQIVKIIYFYTLYNLYHIISYHNILSFEIILNLNIIKPKKTL